MKIRENLKKIRKAWSENQEEFGRHFGLSRNNISSYEKSSANPPMEMLLKLEKMSGIQISRWMEEELEPRDLPAHPIEDNTDSEPESPAYKKLRPEELTDFLKLIEVVVELTEEVKDLKNRVQELEDRG
ncbi:MAG: helix-turn-helix domain-containing protein [Bacteroidetes bacterium]|nr:helix-turn-helix domain-containing protein [Bacteroidota bacterium]